MVDAAGSYTVMKHSAGSRGQTEGFAASRGIQGLKAALHATLRNPSIKNVHK